MAWKSKLKTTYKEADPNIHLLGTWWKDLDPRFVGRLAYVSMIKKCKMVSNSAYRSHEDQKKLYAQYQEYLKTGKGAVKLAAVPGTSRHEYRMAVDTSTQPIRGMTSSQLEKYGLCKPISSEPWHIEPIELKGKSIAVIKRDYLPEEWSDDEVTKDIEIIIEGRVKKVEAILSNGYNYVKLRDLDEVIDVDYDAVKKLPIVNRKRV